ncbi:MAG TPA: alpha/beta hydrolase [Flavisolibacter sp.]|nr:alpha/beta hydrolase [Flavisolibacter sp.]
MKQFLVFVCFALLIACKKDATDNDQPLVAQTLLNISYGNDAFQKMDVYLPAGRSTDSTRLIVLVHGGAWLTGDKSDFTGYVPTLQQRLPGYAVANINYRLATTTANHFPAQENDMKAAVDFLTQKSGEYHISRKLVLLGASSGGHLAALQAYKYSDPAIKAVVDFYGPADMAALYDNATDPLVKSYIQTLMGGTPATNPMLYQQSSPVNFVSAQSPPTIILHGASDELVNINQSTVLKDRLQSAGVVNQLIIYPDQGHDIWPSSIMNDAFDKIEVFIKANVE